MLDGITLKQLRSLKAIAATGSITDAAAAQSLSPPAVHSQIKKLEEILGTPMLTKGLNEKGLVATDQGQVLVAATNRIEGVLSWACDNLDALGTGHAGHVRLGFESTGRYFAPNLVARLNQHYPGIEISFKVANRSTITEDLFAERIDLAIMGRPPRNPVVEATPVGPHPYGLFTSPDHPLAKKGDYDPAALISQTILAREPGSGTRILLDRYLSQIEAYGAPALVELDSNETIKEAVIAGLGVALLSLHVVKRELQAKQLFQLDWPGFPVMRYWYLVRQDTSHTEESTERIIQAIKDENGAFLPG